MPETPHSFKAGVTFCVHCLLTFIRWSVWLILCVVMAAQIYIASTNSLRVPGFILRAFEDRLAASGVKITFGNASFDPSGRILIENAELTESSFPEPIVKARALYGTIDPWSLLEGKFEPKELRLTGVSVFIPAMLSASGKPEEAVKDLDASIALGSTDVAIDYLTCKLGNVDVSAHGTLHVGSFKQQNTGALPLTEFLTENYPSLSRQIASAITSLSALDTPIVHAELSSSESRGALVRVVFVASGLKLTTPAAVQIGALRVSTRFPLLGDSPVLAPIDFSTDSFVGPSGLTARRIHARVRGILKPGLLTYDPKEVEATVASASNGTLRGQALFGDIHIEPNMRFNGQANGWVQGSPLSVSGWTDFPKGTATVDLDAHVNHALLGGVASTINKDLLSFVDPVDPVHLSGTAHFDPGWSFSSFKGGVKAGNAHVHGVTLSAASGLVDINKSHFSATEIYLALFNDHATGTYDLDYATTHFRYLLSGALRPMDISGWFSSWWPNLFANFDFPDSPPNASADVQGLYSDASQATTFVYVEARNPVVRSEKFDYARTRLFIRPYYTDGIEVYITKGNQMARGHYAQYQDPSTGQLSSFDFAVKSTLALEAPIKMFGSAASDLLSPYSFDKPPSVDGTGHLEFAVSPNGSHQHIKLNIASDGIFRLFGFPIDRVKATTTIDDDKIAVSGIDAQFAGGAVTGTTTLAGRGDSQTLTFDARLANANLAQAITTVYAFDAQKNGKPPPPASEFIKDRANVRLEIAAATTGKLSDIKTFTGSGSAGIQGAELGKVQMLGLLSDVLRMTSLRFTTAKANFTVQGARLVFSDISVTGANSAIQAQGAYTMDTRGLDFNAKIYPFQQSNNPFKKGIGLILSPVLAAF